MDIKDIRSVQFDTQFNGYKMQQVDEIIEGLCNLIQKMHSEASLYKQEILTLRQEVTDLESEKLSAYNIILQIRDGK